MGMKSVGKCGSRGADYAPSSRFVFWTCFTTEDHQLDSTVHHSSPQFNSSTIHHWKLESRSLQVWSVICFILGINIRCIISHKFQHVPLVDDIESSSMLPGIFKGSWFLNPADHFVAFLYLEQILCIPSCVNKYQNSNNLRCRLSQYEAHYAIVSCFVEPQP